MKCLYCDRQAKLKKMCWHHYDNLRYNGDPLVDGPNDGRHSHPLYFIWASMRDRCNNKNSKEYHRYGGRGISVCSRWMPPKTGFWNFVNDMGPRPEGYSLDRIDNDKGYSPDNCRWATAAQQNNNRSTAPTTGVRFRKDKKCKQWCARVIVNGKSHSKFYNTKEEAIEGRRLLEKEYRSVL